MPEWAVECAVAEVWGVPPWVVDEAVGEHKLWFWRQLAWNQARAKRSEIADG